MFTVEKEFSFEAAHFLPHHEGKCRRLHGHSYHGRLIAESQELQSNGSSTGMVVDYADLSAAIQPLLDNVLDHYCLNDTLPFSNTTAENLAEWLYNQIKAKIPQLVSVTIEETCSSRVIYRRTRDRDEP